MRTSKPFIPAYLPLPLPSALGRSNGQESWDKAQPANTRIHQPIHNGIHKGVTRKADTACGISPIGLKRFIFGYVHGLPCCALPEEDYSEGIVSERVLSVGISVQSGETSSCARRCRPSQEPPIVQIPRSSLLRLARTVTLRQDRPRKITWRRHWRPGKWLPIIR